jgi:hypothetical protein
MLGCLVGLSLMVYTAEPGSPSADSLRLLTAWNAEAAFGIRRLPGPRPGRAGRHPLVPMTAQAGGA